MTAHNWEFSFGYRLKQAGRTAIVMLSLVQAEILFNDFLRIPHVRFQPSTNLFRIRLLHAMQIFFMITDFALIT